MYFNQHFGAFWRINTFYITTLNGEDHGKDIFQTPYLELLYYVQVSFIRIISSDVYRPL